jgi:uncharacterized protein
MRWYNPRAIRLLFLACLICCSAASFAQRDSDFPPPPNPPRLVNDLANVLSPDEEELLEQKALAFADSTSNEIAIVTVQSIGEYDVADYTTRLGNKWGVGKASRKNGVLILAAIKDHRMNISVGKGLEGALTDLVSGRIIRNEMAPAFRENNYYRGFDRALDAVSAATRGEYEAEPKSAARKVGRRSIIPVIIIVLVILWIMRKGGGGGGTYMSRRGWGGFGGGFLTGSMLGGGWGGGGGGWGGGSSGGGGGFGGFGGGSFGGGGASGSW